MQVSHKHDHMYLINDDSLERKIDVYEAQIFGWQLDIADTMLNGFIDEELHTTTPPMMHSAFAAMQIYMSYFEAVSKFQAGFIGDFSKLHFCLGFKLVFPPAQHIPATHIDKFLKHLYSSIRCSLYHLTLVGSDVQICSSGESLQYFTPPGYPPLILINPHKMIKCVKIHFSNYIRELRSGTNTTLTSNFEVCFDNQRWLKL